MRAASELSMPDRLGAMSDTTTSTGRPPSAASSARQHLVLAEVALEEVTPSIGSIGSMSSAMIVPSSAPTAAPPAPAACGAKRRRTYWLQAPGAAPRSTTIWPGLEQAAAPRRSP